MEPPHPFLPSLHPIDDRILKERANSSSASATAGSNSHTFSVVSHRESEQRASLTSQQLDNHTSLVNQTASLPFVQFPPQTDCPFVFEHDLNPVIHRPFLCQRPAEILSDHDTTVATHAPPDEIGGDLEGAEQERGTISLEDSPTSIVVPTCPTIGLTRSSNISPNETETAHSRATSDSSKASYPVGSSLGEQSPSSDPDHRPRSAIPVRCVL